MHRRTLTIATATAAVAVVAAGLGLWYSSDRDAADVVSAAPPAVEMSVVKPPVTVTPPPDQNVPGKGVVDVPQGELHDVPPMTFNRPGMMTGEPVGVAGPGDNTGWVAWTDFSPSKVPVQPDIPQAMVPIRDQTGRQIAWWSNGLGWVSFETVSQPGYDFVKAYQAWLTESTPSCEDAEKALSAELNC